MLIVLKRATDAGHATHGFSWSTPRPYRLGLRFASFELGLNSTIGHRATAQLGVRSSHRFGCEGLRLARHPQRGSALSRARGPRILRLDLVGVRIVQVLFVSRRCRPARLEVGAEQWNAHNQGCASTIQGRQQRWGAERIVSDMLRKGQAGVPNWHGRVSRCRVLAAKEADLVKNPAKLGAAIAKMQTFISGGSCIAASAANPVRWHTRNVVGLLTVTRPCPPYCSRGG